jgi:hypothetical protein
MKQKDASDVSCLTTAIVSTPLHRVSIRLLWVVDPFRYGQSASWIKATLDEKELDQLADVASVFKKKKGMKPMKFFEVLMDEWVHSALLPQ